MIYNMKGDVNHAGPVRLSDVYSSAVGSAKDGVAASQRALYDAYNSLNSRISMVNVEQVAFTRDTSTGSKYIQHKYDSNKITQLGIHSDHLSLRENDGSTWTTRWDIYDIRNRFADQFYTYSFTNNNLTSSVSLDLPDIATYVVFVVLISYSVPIAAKMEMVGGWNQGGTQKIGGFTIFESSGTTKFTRTDAYPSDKIIRFTYSVNLSGNQALRAMALRVW